MGMLPPARSGQRLRACIRHFRCHGLGGPGHAHAAVRGEELSGTDNDDEPHVDSRSPRLSLVTHDAASPWVVSSTTVLEFDGVR